MGDSKEIGRNISSFRKAKGMTQKQLAEQLFVSVSAVSKWENGESMPDVYRVKELAKVFDVSVSTLLGEGDVVHADNDLGDRVFYIDLQAKKDRTAEQKISDKTVKDKRSRMILKAYTNVVLMKVIFLAGAILLTCLIAICVAHMKEGAGRRNNTSKENISYEDYFDFEIADEFLKESGKIFGYESVYYIVVEYEKVQEQDKESDLVTCQEAWLEELNVRENYRHHYNKAEAIAVVFCDKYTIRAELEECREYMYLYPIGGK